MVVELEERKARKWKILMFNQLLMSEFNVVT